MRTTKEYRIETDLLQSVTEAAQSNNVDIWSNEGREELERIEAWRDAAGKMIAKVASIVAGRSINTEWTSAVPIAATDGQNILLSIDWWNNEIVPALAKRNMASTAREWGIIKGLAYHELSHILWTPRAKHKPTKDIPDHHRWVWNMLEDQRIESFFVARYTPSIPFFTQIILEFIANQDCYEEAWHVWPLVHGRTYLSSDIRDHYRQKFDEATGGQSSVIAPLIDEYKTLTFPSDGERGLEIVETLHDFLSQYSPVARNAMELENEHQFQKQGRTVPVAEEREDRDRASAQEKQERDTESASASDSGQNREGEPSSETTTGRVADNQAVTEQITETLDELESHLREEGLDIVRTLSRVVRESAGGVVPSVNETFRRRSEPVTEAMQADASRLAREIGLVFAEHEDHWVRGNTSGRLNVVDAMEAQGRHFDVFDSWQEADDDDISFEVVILYDRSTSMDGWTNEEGSRCLWVTQRAFESLDIPTTVIGYSNDASMMSHRNTTAHRDTYDVSPVIGGTDPNQALEWTQSIMRQSTARHKVVVSITDGAWWDCDRPEGPIIVKMDALHDMGCQSLMITIDSSPQWLGRAHGYYNGHKRLVALKRNTIRRLPNEVGKVIAELAAETTAMVAA